MQLAAGKNPNLIREMLVAYLPEKARAQMMEDEPAAAPAAAPTEAESPA
jgi:flagellar motor component MotA